ncbi:MAG: cytochrome b/b6 domain-containing protein [Gammaproteobacteria bacterium]|nr:cytochrome b/b6 domain-containing protein [Gammaproteobacteria bacterium]MBU1440662.1 cytochrome b/b6 domain-containing protein [Gammaproteobacteria bacterium]MBU2287137.1 cytochrome b/b6 domain-containing protein [Gammaproteobacteria bacterium]
MKVWDRPVRLLHWVLVLTVVPAWVTGGRTDSVHEWLGYAAAAVVAARLVWGVLGSRYARFRQFVRGPAWTLRYASAVAAHRAPRYLGHNPLGGWMAVTLLACVGCLSLSGFLYISDWLWGYAWLYWTHFVLGWLLVALVALHLAGVAFSSWQHRENLVRAMVTGKKAAPGEADVV